jgi:hypothetical protein
MLPSNPLGWRKRSTSQPCQRWSCGKALAGSVCWQSPLEAPVPSAGVRAYFLRAQQPDVQFVLQIPSRRWQCVHDPTQVLGCTSRLGLCPAVCIRCGSAPGIFRRHVGRKLDRELVACPVPAVFVCTTAAASPVGFVRAAPAAQFTATADAVGDSAAAADAAAIASHRAVAS